MYQYFGCGLEGIFLKNGYAIVQTPHGEAVKIDGVEQLHEAIAADIVGQPYPMSGHQFRFLRKEQELTQAEYAALTRVDAQTVANWEKRGKQDVPGPADLAMRLLYAVYADIALSNPNIAIGARTNEARSLEKEDEHWISRPSEAA